MSNDLQSGTSQQSLDELAADIKSCLDRANKSMTRLSDLRITAGLMLVEAQTRIMNDPAYKGSPKDARWAWLHWRRRHFKRSARDIRRCIALVKSGDPEAAREQEKARNRIAAAKHRAKRTEVSPAAPTPANVDGMTSDETAALATVRQLLEGGASSAFRNAIEGLAWETNQQEAA